MRAMVLALTASLGAIGAFIMPTTAAQQAGADAQERTRLLQLQRDTVTQLQQAARPDLPADQVRRAVLNASRGLEGLSRGPSFEASLRSDLRRAASDLASLAARDTPAAASAIGPVLALLEKVRAQFQSGEIFSVMVHQGQSHPSGHLWVLIVANAKVISTRLSIGGMRAWFPKLAG
jgi:hypothetical protein